MTFRANDRFDVFRQVGAGAMGVVYEAWDKDRNTRVALKTLTGLHAQALQLFKNEFRALADVSHPNLAALHELFFEDQWFFSMEYVEGEHFLDFVRPGGPSAQLPALSDHVLGPDDPTYISGDLVQLVLSASGDRSVQIGRASCRERVWCLV